MSRRAVWIALASVLLVGVAFVTLFPIRTYLHQRHQIATVSAQLSQLRHANSALAAQARKLNSDTAIAKMAHQDYGLVKPGQEAYEVLPTTTTTTSHARGAKASAATSPTNPTQPTGTTTAP